MINVNTTIMNDNIIMLFVINTWIVIHLGKNPRNGGSPPRDKKLRINKIFINILLFNDVNNCFK